MYSSLPEFFWRESPCIQYTLSVKLAVFHTSVILDCAGQQRGGALESIINVLKKSEMQKNIDRCVTSTSRRSGKGYWYPVL